MPSKSEVLDKATQLRSQARQLEKLAGLKLQRKDIAAAIGVSVQSLATWEREGAPVAEIVNETLEDAVEYLKDWRDTHKRPRFNNVTSADGGLEEQLLAAQVREKNAAADAKEIANVKRRGELYEADDVNLQVAELCGMIRSELQSIPQQLENEWPAEVRGLVTETMAERIHLILTRMSQWRLDV